MMFVLCTPKNAPPSPHPLTLNFLQLPKPTIFPNLPQLFNSPLPPPQSLQPPNRGGMKGGREVKG